jgi:hypothetical protein
MAEEEKRAKLRFRPGKPGGEGVPIDLFPVVDAIQHLEFEVVTRLDSTKAVLDQILNTQKNADMLTVGTLLVAVAGTPVQLPLLALPDGKSGVLYALQANVGDVYFGGSQSEASQKFFPIPAGESRTVKVKNFNSVWINADNAGDGIAYGVEINIP